MSSNIQFCKGCLNLLAPQEDKRARMLRFTCHRCDEVTYVDQDRPQDNSVDVKNFNLHSVEDIGSHILPGLDQDPTLPRVEDWRCANCGQQGAVYFQLPERVASDAMTLVYVCIHCTHYEVKGKVAEDTEDVE